MEVPFDLDPITLILKLELDMAKMYPYTNKEASWLHAELFLCCGFLDTTWCASGNHVVGMWKSWGVLWKPCSVHLETIWCPYGNHLVSRWKPQGVHMETMWCLCGNHVVSTWRPHCVHVETMWYPCRNNVVFAFWNILPTS